MPLTFAADAELLVPTLLEEQQAHLDSRNVASRLVLPVLLPGSYPRQSRPPACWLCCTINPTSEQRVDAILVLPAFGDSVIIRGLRHLGTAHPAGASAGEAEDGTAIQDWIMLDGGGWRAPACTGRVCR